MDDKERRAYPRFTIPISVSYFNPETKKIVCVNTNDISVEGLGLITDQELRPGQLLDINLEMSDNGEKIPLKGKVIWTSKIDAGKFRVGVRLEGQKINPVPIVLRTIKKKRNY